MSEHRESLISVRGIGRGVEFWEDRPSGEGSVSTRSEEIGLNLGSQKGNGGLKTNSSIKTTFYSNAKLCVERTPLYGLRFKHILMSCREGGI